MGISVKQFKEILKEQTQKICSDEGKDWNNEVHRGYAFQLWNAEIISNFETNFETEFEDAVLGSKDLKADIVFEDTVNKQLLICQCKFTGLSKLKPMDEDEIISFFDRHQYYMNRSWIEAHGSQDAIFLLADYSEKMKEGYKVIFRFISSGESSNRILEMLNSKNEHYNNSEFNISCELYDFSGLKEYYVRSQTTKDSIPESVKIPIREATCSPPSIL